MSGGVDSSVAAWLLKKEGWDVIGITMKVWPQDCISRAEDKCCGPQAVADARGVAHALDIPHYVIDEADDFEKMVIDYFTSEYNAGRTPNPCVMCNDRLKFGNLIKKASALGATHVATGHYAIIDRSADKAKLRRGLDPRKDQSYFLFSLRQEQLDAAVFPLGTKEKPEIREIAKELGLRVYDKEDSQEICFVPGNDYKAFLKSHMGDDEFHPGGIYDKEGNRLGDHEGMEFYTIGQRKGLGGGSSAPRYVIDIDPATSSVIVGDQEDLFKESCTLRNLTWNDEPLTSPRKGTVKIRHNHAAAAATIHPDPDKPEKATIVFDEPQRAVTPGQGAVFFDGDWVVGGGWIERTIDFLPIT